ncbi:MAG: UDP-N-acetylmuramate dehydrogenase [Aestuariibacter sp.]
MSLHYEFRHGVNVVNLKNFHSFQFDVHANKMSEISCVEGLAAFDYSQDTLFLGEGSNIVFVEDFAGSLLRYTHDKVNIKEHQEYFDVSVGAGHQWHQLVESLLSKGIFGLENLALIPGTVGAAPIQNIGAYGAEFKEFCQFVEVYDFKHHCHRRLSVDDCLFSYRNSIFKYPENRHLLITQVGMRFSKRWQANLSYKGVDHLAPNCSAKEVFDTVVQVRQAKLPDYKALGNAGSFFKNPIITEQHFENLQSQYPDIPGYAVDGHLVKVPAAWCIDKCGFKGKQVGAIASYIKQPLVLVNMGNGTGEQLLDLARQIVEAVKAQFSIGLENEVTLMGAHGKLSL